MNLKISFFILLISILLLAVLPTDGLEFSRFPFVDKLKHIFAFFILGLFFHISFKNISITLKLLILTTFAFLIEFIQTFTARESSLFDFLSSVLGIIIYLIVLKTLQVTLKKFRSR